MEEEEVAKEAVEEMEEKEEEEEEEEVAREEREPHGGGMGEDLGTSVKLTWESQSKKFLKTKTLVVLRAVSSEFKPSGNTLLCVLCLALELAHVLLLVK